MEGERKVVVLSKQSEMLAESDQLEEIYPMFSLIGILLTVYNLGLQKLFVCICYYLFILKSGFSDLL